MLSNRPRRVALGGEAVSVDAVAGVPEPLSQGRHVIIVRDGDKATIFEAPDNHADAVILVARLGAEKPGLELLVCEVVKQWRSKIWIEIEESKP